ncbi:MAG: GNAT family N-acetyltransferase [Cellulosilyticum sp.]|nr:GNAT family N-acetyltransferase [Cellulosilyticum sp.]
MKIRRIKESDLEDLRLLYIALCNEERSLEKIKVSFKQVEQNQNYYLLGAEVDGKIVGTLMGIVCYDVAGEGKNFMTLENVVVLEDYRGRGICRSLFNEIEKIAQVNQCDYIYFVSGAQRKEAHALYTALGYADEKAKGFRKHFHKSF